MKFTSATATALYLLGSATLSLAVALPDSTSPLQARNQVAVNSLPTEAIHCLHDGNWVTITPEIIHSSIDYAARKADGSVEGYPSKITNPSSIPDMPNTGSSTVRHYPIAQTTAGVDVYTGKNWADLIRVFYISGKKASPAFTYLGVWTHVGASTGQFLHCKTTAEWNALQHH